MVEPLRCEKECTTERCSPCAGSGSCASCGGDCGHCDGAGVCPVMNAEAMEIWADFQAEHNYPITREGFIGAWRQMTNVDPAPHLVDEFMERAKKLAKAAGVTL